MHANGLPGKFIPELPPPQTDPFTPFHAPTRKRPGYSRGTFDCIDQQIVRR
jgi:hypothetical protein